MCVGGAVKEAEHSMGHLKIQKEASSKGGPQPLYASPPITQPCLSEPTWVPRGLILRGTLSPASPFLP